MSSSYSGMGLSSPGGVTYSSPPYVNGFESPSDSFGALADVHSLCGQSLVGNLSAYSGENSAIESCDFASFDESENSDYALSEA